MKAAIPSVNFRVSPFKSTLLTGLIILNLTVGFMARGDGCFVFRWDKKKDINEPTQKAIIVYDAGQEDLVLQVKYEGPAEEFGWLVPVPGLPTVKKGTMDCFYELSRFTQEFFALDAPVKSAGSRSLQETEVKVIEIKTVGAYEVAVLKASSGSALGQWLDAHHFVFPKDHQAVLDSYVKQDWYFVASKINPEGNGFSLKSGPSKTISASTRAKLFSGELHPLVISFPAKQCVFPLAISAVNGKPSEISLYVLSAEPLLNRMNVEKALETERAETARRLASVRQLPEARPDLDLAGRRRPLSGSDDPADPPPSAPPWPSRNALSTSDYLNDEIGSARLLGARQIDSRQLPVCSKEIPRLNGKTWWLMKDVRTFSPSEMRDLYYEPAVPVLADGICRPGGASCARTLDRLGVRAVPTFVKALKSSDANERRLALCALQNREIIGDSRVKELVIERLNDPDPHIRFLAVEAARHNLAGLVARRILGMLADPESRVQEAAYGAIRDDRMLMSMDPEALGSLNNPEQKKLLLERKAESKERVSACRRMAETNNSAGIRALCLLSEMGGELSRSDVSRILVATNVDFRLKLGLFRFHQSDIRPHDLALAMTHADVTSRLLSVGYLGRLSSKEAIDEIVSIALHDPDEFIRWRAREYLRRVFDQKLGADSKAYEKWWKENRNGFVIPSPQRGRLRR